MHAGSLMEIYTTMFGWSLYNTFFEILSMTGFLYFPLFMALYKNWKEPIMSQDDKPASIISQRRMTYDVIAIMLVFAFAIVPAIELRVDEIHVRSACTDPISGAEVINQDVYGNATGTTYDGQFNDSDNVRIPALWWLVLTVTSGVNSAATSSFSCFEDIKGLDQQLRNLTIKDQALRHEYYRFAYECFLPAKSKYLQALRGGDYYEYVKDQSAGFFAKRPIKSKYDETDPYYIGSHFYLETAGFYNWNDFNKTSCTNTPSGCSMQARRPVSGWGYNASRDNYSAEDIAANIPGRPFCDEWWADPAPLGLKEKLLDSIEASKIEVFGWDNKPGTTFFQKMNATIDNAYAKGANLLGNKEKLEDLIIKRYVQVDPPNFVGAGASDFADVSPRSFQQSVLNGGGALGAVAGATELITFPAFIAGAGKATYELAETAKDFYVTMFIVKSIAPMVQATILMMLYALMIFYFVISEYDIDSIITMIFLILAVRFFTSLWVFADYIDARLYTAMYPDISHIGSVLTQGVNRYLLDMVFTILYIAVPGLFLFIMTLAGQNVSRLGASSNDLSARTEKLKLGKVK